MASIASQLLTDIKGLFSRQFAKGKRRRRREKEALWWDWESASTMDNEFGEEYDVFLSFRGSDTRRSFTDNLYRSMVRAGIRVFLESEELEDDTTSREVLKAVNGSQIYIPIFSRNFASSKKCLREVALMVECASKSDGKKEIIPIFYDVKPDDVKLKTELYKKVLRKHKKKVASYELQQWESALRTIGRITGRELKGKRLGEEINAIVEEVSRKLNQRHMIMTEYLVEDNDQLKAIMKLLDVGSDGVRFVGIHGTGGVGKTTLAKVMLNKLSFHFEGCCFLEDVRASSQTHGGLLNLQKKFLSSFVSSRITDQIGDIDGGIRMIKKVFSNKKVLVVLDDVDNKEQLKNLAGKSDWFGSGSRIIITTRDKNILRTLVYSSRKEILDQPDEILAYEVQPMKADIALRLFCKHAFRSDFAIKEYATLSRDIVSRVGMLPLAVVVIGSYLFDMGNDLGHSDKREVWKDTLRKLEEGPFEDVRNSLLISYERLERKEQELFLDIACFFTNGDILYPIIMWDDCDYYPHTAMRALSDKSLVEVRDNKFLMHNQVRDFGRSNALREYPNKISRVWIREEALELLEAKKRNEDVTALSLTFSGHSFTQEELACLPNLRFLRVNGSDFDGNFENLLPELRWLSWQAQQTTFHANNFHFSKLVVLDLSDSNIEDGWGGWSQMKMNKLKVLDLTGCMRLKTTPDFSNFMSLEKLILARCVKLTTIDSSIGKLVHLTTLNIKGCSSLGKLPAEIGSLGSLTEIVMPQNFQPFKLPETIGNLISLGSFTLDEHPGIKQLPESIGGLAILTHLSFRGCVGIKELPYSVGDLQMLVELDVSKSGIVTLPDSIGKLKKLRVMRIGYTNIRYFPCAIGGVEMLEELHAKKCRNLTDVNLEEIGKLSHLRILDLSYSYVCRLPEVIGRLSHLQELRLGSPGLLHVTALPSSLTYLEIRGTDFSFIPDLSSLVNLNYLELSRLSALKNNPPQTEAAFMKERPLPSRLSTLKLKGISPLPDFSNLIRLTVLHVSELPLRSLDVSQGLIHLRELKISGCEFMEQIPGLSLLKSLERLHLNRLDRLVGIQDLSGLESLQYLYISDCRLLGRLPDLPKLEKPQHSELEVFPNLRAIEGAEGSKSWELDSHGRTVLERLLDVSRSTWISSKVVKCQVFLSFSALDTPYGIIDSLYENLIRNQVSAFKDDEELISGDEIGEELLLTLYHSDIYITLFSENYASSEWCLRELAHMVGCMSKSHGKKRILPIFYGVDVHDVMLESNLYRSALDDHRSKFGSKVEEWEKALRQVAGIGGFQLKTMSPDGLIESVVQEVLHTLDAQNLVEDHQIKAVTEKLDVDSDAGRFLDIHGVGGIDETVLANPVSNKSTSEEEDQNQPEGILAHAIAAVQNVVGIDDRVIEITNLLEMEVNDEVRILAIYGPDGIGKTTLAKAVYDRISSCFDSRSFLTEVKETARNRWGIQFLQTRLVCDILERDREDPSFDERIEDFLDIFCERKVLIVVDDVEEQSHLREIVGKQLHWFGPGSQIIVTSENEEILNEFDPEKARTYRVGALDDGQAFELFCEHAFRMQSSIPDYDGLANRIVNATEKLPLAVEVVGSFLRGKSIQEWAKMEESMKARPMSSQKATVGLEEILDICYKGLNDQQKDIYLDIACFISGVDARIASCMWPSSYRPSSGCVLMPLAKIGENNKLQMHRLPKCLGKRILDQEESQDPRSRRFCTQDTVLKAMNKETGTGNFEALCFDFTAGDFQSMPNIRFLKWDNAKLSGDFEGAFPSLRGLCWQRCPPEFGAENLVLGELAHLDLSWSKITEDWGGWKKIKMEKLKVLNLTGCSDLLFTPDFSGYKDLKVLILEGCSRLVKLDPSIGHLKRLISLNLKSCSQLNGLPVELGGATALEELFIDRTSVQEIPISIGNLKKLKILSGFECSPLAQLPRSICYLTALSELSLHGAEITELPSSLGDLLKLRRLSLRNCRYLEELPDSIGRMGSLKELDISGTHISELPGSIGNLESLKLLRMDSSFVRAFPVEIGNLTNLEELHASWCRSLKGAIPSDIKGLCHLRSMTLSHSRISSLPPETSTILGLHTLNLIQCNEIRELPKLPPCLIRLRVSSKRMKAIVLEDLKELEELCLSDGDPKARRPPSAIEKIEGLEGLEALKRLDISNCRIQNLNGIGQLASLTSLILSDCDCLSSLDLSNSKSLKVLEIRRCKMIHQIEGIKELASLKKLIISECPALKHVEDTFHGNVTLHEVHYSV